MKLFSSEESPSLIGLSAQDHRQAKAWVNSKGAESVDKLPPGFDGTNLAYAFHNKFSKIPIIKWQCPPKVGGLRTAQSRLFLFIHIFLCCKI